MSAKSQMSKLLDQLMGQNRDGEFSAVFKPILKINWPQWWNKGCDNFGFFNICVSCLCTCLNNFSYPSLVVAEIGS